MNKIVPESLLRVGTHPTYPFGVEHSELEGLNLNIFVPLSSLAEGAEPIPVMTWIHGGAYRNGANCVPLYGMCAHEVELIMKEVRLGGWCV